MTPRAFAGRARQAWTIAKIELRRAFFARRSLWVYVLALLPAVIFFGHGLEAKFRSERLARRGVIGPALMDSVREGETADDVKKRLGKPAGESSVDADTARPAAQRECGDDHPRDRADGRSPLRPPECQPSFLQRGAGGQDLRVRGLRAGWQGEPRAQSARHGKSAVQPGAGAGEGGERQRGGRPGRSVVR